MTLTDVMSQTGLSAWQAVALVIFVATFAAVLIHTLLFRTRSEMKRAARLPIDEQLADARPNDDGKRGSP
jgi:hypothetical protein